MMHLKKLFLICRSMMSPKSYWYKYLNYIFDIVYLVIKIICCQVCRKFNETSQKLLNKGYAAVQLNIKKCQKEIREKHRDSKRQAHSLAKHMDVLTGILA